MKRLSAALVALAISVLPAMAAGTAPAQVVPNSQASAQCAPISVALAYLAKHYGEHVLWWGQTGDHVTMIITERTDTSTWTLLAVHNGVACMVGSGGNRNAEGS